MQDIWLLCGDARIRWAAQALRQAGFCVHTHGVPEAPSESLPELLSLTLLPFPSIDGDHLPGATPLPLTELLPRLSRHSVVLGGKLGRWKAAMNDRGAAVFDLYASEPFTTFNAALTAEGALALAMSGSPAALCGASCLVVGYGRIGKLLAQRLDALGASVTVAARKAEDRALAEAWGARTDIPGIYSNGLEAYEFVFNTVPAPVFHPEDFQRFSPHAVLLELASAPGGFPQDEAAMAGRTVLNGAGLPGRCSPKAAGELYARCVISTLKREGFL